MQVMAQHGRIPDVLVVLVLVGLARHQWTLECSWL